MRSHYMVPFRRLSNHAGLGVQTMTYACRQNSNKNPKYPSQFCWTPFPTPLPPS